LALFNVHNGIILIVNAFQISDAKVVIIFLTNKKKVEKKFTSGGNI